MAVNRYQCPACGEVQNMRSSSEGTIQKCKGCGEKVRVPEAGIFTQIMRFVSAINKMTKGSKRK